MNNTVLITNIEYDFLYNKGGDNLIAFFASLRYYKPGIVYNKKGRKGSHATIRHYTGLSLNTIKKYLPLLIKEELVYVQHNGNIGVRSRNWTTNNLPALNNHKLIPIEIHKKFTDTKWSVFYVRTDSNILKQNNAAAKKAERIKLLHQHQEGRIWNLKELKRAEKLIKYGSDLQTIKSSYRSNSTLSNSKFAELRNPNLSQYSGQYGKHKLIKLGYIRQERKYEVLDKNNSKAAWDFWRYVEGKKNCFISNYGISMEISPDIFLTRNT